MKTPFTIEQFFSVFENYNRSVFPSQIILFLLGILTILTIKSTHRYKNKFISGFLGLLWLWIGIVYHISFFTEINKVAFGFGGLFILQGLLFLWEGVYGDRLKFEISGSVQGYLGFFFVIYGLIIYPIIGFLIEQNVDRSISLGLPCPTTIFSFGMLLLAGKNAPKYLLIIPSIWAVIGISAVINLGVYQDTMMFISAIVSGIIIIRRK